jgi:hypothetical protein
MALYLNVNFICKTTSSKLAVQQQPRPHSFCSIVLQDCTPPTLPAPLSRTERDQPAASILLVSREGEAALPGYTPKIVSLDLAVAVGAALAELDDRQVVHWRMSW